MSKDQSEAQVPQQMTQNQVGNTLSTIQQQEGNADAATQNRHDNVTQEAQKSFYEFASKGQVQSSLTNIQPENLTQHEQRFGAREAEANRAMAPEVSLQ